MKNILFASISVAVFTALSQQSVMAETVQLTKAEIVMKASFKDRGQAKVDRLNQDETQRLCSQFPDKRPKEITKKIEAPGSAAAGSNQRAATGMTAPRLATRDRRARRYRHAAQLLA